MALVRNYLGRFTSGVPHGTGGFTTASMTPDANSLLVVVVSAIDEDSSGGNFTAMTIADSLGHTWTERAYGDVNTWETGIKIFTAPNTATTEFTITADCGGESVHIFILDVFSYTGQHASPIGATAAASDQAGNGAVSTTLSGTPATTSEVVAGLVLALNSSGNTGVTHGTGWTEIADTRLDEWMAFQTQIRTGSTSTTVGWDDAYVGSGTADNSALVALEILSAEGGASAVLTGTAVGGITEADVVSGGRTIVITLSGDTFIPN